MKRVLMFIGFTVILLATSIGVYPNSGAAASSEIQKIEAQIKELQKQIASTQEAEQEAKKEIERVRRFQEIGMAEIARLTAEIEQTSKKIAELNNRAKEVEESLELTVQELAEAEKTVETRDALMKSRIRFMYMHGFVNYLDVLLSATNFGDFLDRLNALQLIVQQDKTILAQNIEAKMMVEQKKAEIEQQLAYVQELHEQTAALKRELEVKKSNKEVAVASWEAKEQELVEITEKQEQELMQLADEMSAKLRKKEQLEAEERRKKKVTKYDGGQFAWPVPDSYRITSRWGTRTHPISGKKHTHSGLDIGAPSGTDIVAAAAGQVVLAQWYGGFGNTVIIEHEPGLRTLYAHIRNGGIKVKVGDYVEKGDKIAEVGSTGNSTGPHLHFGVYVNGSHVDPEPYLKK